MELDEYISTLVDFLELLPPTMGVKRNSGENRGRLYIGPRGVLISQRFCGRFKQNLNRETLGRANDLGVKLPRLGSWRPVL